MVNVFVESGDEAQQVKYLAELENLLDNRKKLMVESKISQNPGLIQAWLEKLELGPDPVELYEEFDSKAPKGRLYGDVSVLFGRLIDSLALGKRTREMNRLVQRILSEWGHLKIRVI